VTPWNGGGEGRDGNGGGEPVFTQRATHIFIYTVHSIYKYELRKDLHRPRETTYIPGVSIFI